MSIFWIKKMEQAALLADSFKLSILEKFADEPCTAKQVAEQLKIKQTRLYRHIDALLQAGLLKLVREQQKRGTVERFYQTVATRFEIDSSLFLTGKAEQNEVIHMARSIMRDTEQEVSILFDKIGADNLMGDGDVEPLLMRLSVQGTADQIASLRKKLDDWLKECEKTNSKDSDEEKLSFRGLVLFYPLLKTDD